MNMVSSRNYIYNIELEIYWQIDLTFYYEILIKLFVFVCVQKSPTKYSHNCKLYCEVCQV